MGNFRARHRSLPAVLETVLLTVRQDVAAVFRFNKTLRATACKGGELLMHTRTLMLHNAVCYNGLHGSNNSFIVAKPSGPLWSGCNSGARLLPPSFAPGRFAAFLSFGRPYERRAIAGVAARLDALAQKRGRP